MFFTLYYKPSNFYFTSRAKDTPLWPHTQWILYHCGVLMGAVKHGTNIFGVKHIFYSARYFALHYFLIIK